MGRFVALLCLAGIFAGHNGCTATQCVPQTISLGMGTVLSSSTDAPNYIPGDIFYRNCAEPSDRQYIGWCPSSTDKNPQVQIRLPHVTAIYEIVFQTTVTDCAVPGRDYSREPFLMEFDLHYVLPEDNGGHMVLYKQNLKALDAHSSEVAVSFINPLTTSTIKITPKISNVYPCFRFKIIGCKAEGLCDPDYCLNGGTCVGTNHCKCQYGFLGERCNKTIQDVLPYDYGFEKIENNQLFTPDAIFDVTGDVSLSTDRRRDHHHGHHCHMHSDHHHQSYCSFNSHHDHHSSDSHHHDDHHDHHHSGGGSSSGGSTSQTTQNSHCMSGLNEHHQGFTTAMYFAHEHSHHGDCHLFSNGGNLPGHQGASLAFSSQTQQFTFQVSSQTHRWEVTAPCQPCQADISNHVAVSWHPHTGAHIYVNNQHAGGTGQGTPHPAPANRTVDLRIGNGHIQIDISANINISITGLNMYAAPAQQLQTAGVKTFTAAPPPPTQPTTMAPVTATTTPHTTTLPPVTATTNHGSTTANTGPTTTAAHRPVCYSFVDQPAPKTVTTRTRCNVGEVCTLYEDQGGYTAKCLPQSLCESGKRLRGGQCWECCDTYLCNSRCSASTSVKCEDKSSCPTMMLTGFDVCSDPTLAYDMCRKTCSIC